MGWARSLAWRRGFRTWASVKFSSPAGFSAPLLWLQNCLVQAANDREEDGEWVKDGFSGTVALEAAGRGREDQFFLHVLTV